MSQGQARRSRSDLVNGMTAFRQDQIRVGTTDIGRKAAMGCTRLLLCRNDLEGHLVLAMLVQNGSTIALQAANPDIDKLLISLG